MPDRNDTNNNASAFTKVDLWWKQAVVYQVYPRSFKDSTGSGLGDIAGVTSQMDYLSQLGIDAIWLSPFYPSELADGGYDVQDYRDVDPKLGTMDDFDAMVEAAHSHGIKVVVDIVPNHSSHLHPWFQAALKAGPGSPERDRYVFRDGRGEHGELPPTNWIANFGGSAWTRVSDGQWYLHLFAKEQPDFNWDNREVRDDFLKTLTFWCDHGTDGFRVDVAEGLAKDLDRDDLDDYDVDAMHITVTDGSHPVYDRDEVHEIFREWRKEVFDKYTPARFAVGEAWVPSSRQHLYARPDELGQVFNFAFAECNWSRAELHDAIQAGIDLAARTNGSTSTWVMSNHDVPRHASRYALPQVETDNGLYHAIANDWLLRDGRTYHEDRELGTKRAKAAIMLEMALPGSAYVYQGEELGLFEVADIPWNELEDPWASGTRQALTKKGRDGCRVPLPWTSDADGTFGFSPDQCEDGQPVATPHLPQPAWFADYAVTAEEGDDDSMLSHYRKVLALRHQCQCEDTSLRWLDGFDRSSGLPDGANGLTGGVIAYARANGWANVTNFSREAVELPQGKVLLTSQPLDDQGRLPQDASAWMMLD
ncbi:alpha-1,4-glucosidase [Bifidobacterium actinocoloniiforme DSM 22766]|uniref:Alpha-1,4-glucosidase n=1 Tax=Bifidobacterium actinocoloniiforme DSM 22766 TaxID=1437605 RepID=A0A086YZE8_9BIFI|nr:glycoside hydrolase family 13 protein [Bifidobacterium actinocoloniiforme]AKV54985.1 alpha-amylase [Bifidobacterium actinocoloniiforme DSM 22766]KFI39648.1 alpha-1,4-glucosidase [Bifidobacterium actinocoloniiforme DSM 22766]